MAGEIDQLDFVSSSGTYKDSTGASGDLIVARNKITFERRPPTRHNKIDRDGWRSPSPYHHLSLRLNCEPVPFTILKYGSGCRRSVELRGTRTGLVSPDNIPDAAKPRVSKTENEALIKALNRARDQKINVSVALAEARESYRTVNHRLRSIALSVLHFRRQYPKLWEQVKRCHIGARAPRGSKHAGWCQRKRKSTFRNPREGIPSGWLELQYGWLPLMADIQGAINEFAREPAPPRIYAKGTGTSDWTERWRLTASAGVAGLRAGSDSGYFEAQFSQQAYCSLVYELSDTDKRSAGQLGLISPSEVVWELLPYSFVVDWALPIGPWLSALHADKGLKFKGGSLATVMKATEAGSAGPYHSTTCGDLDSRYGVRLDIKSFDRKAYLEPPFPGLYVKNPLSVLHALNGLALLRQAFR